MFFKITLYIATAVFLLGLCYRVSAWFRYSLGEETEGFSAGRRVFAALRGLVLTLLSPRILTLVKVFVLEVLLQTRTLRESSLRWVMHSCIFWGFMLLLLTHALDQFVTAKLFKDYSATLNPFLFLRNLFGVLVILGLCISFYRRFVLKAPRLLTNMMDKITMVILSVVMVSGFFLEAAKIISYRAYSVMVEDYAGQEDEEARKALEGYWVESFGSVSPNVKGPIDQKMLARGREVHETACASCHSRPQWAFASYGLSRVGAPMAMGLDRAHLPTLLWYIHFLACFIGLAYLPFSRLFHVFVTPLSLLANAVMSREGSDPVNFMTKQIMELDACTHCGTCSGRCAVGIWTEEIGNMRILPSEKIAPMRAFVSGKGLGEEGVSGVQEGLCLCSNCYRCTVVCPAGIKLQELWFSVREALFREGHPALLTLSPLSLYRGLRREEIVPGQYERPVELARRAIDAECKGLSWGEEPIDFNMADREFKKRLGLSAWGKSFSACFTCTTCTSSCPVVRQFSNPPAALGLTPHQIIHVAILGFCDPIFRSNMLWSCLGCYQCQEACPQGVRVADVLYQLKNMAMEHMKGLRSRS